MPDHPISAPPGVNLNKLKSFLPWGAAALLISLVLAGFDPAGELFSGWLGYLVLAELGALIILAIWRWLEAPRWLLITLGVAVALRLVAGIGLYLALPEFGYDSIAHKNGYLFYDAYKRDTGARMLVRNGVSPLAALSEVEQGDQYGGISVFTVATYSLLSPDQHRPLLMVTIATATAAVAVLAGWGFVSSLFGSAAGKLAAWILAVYPEFVLLGSSNMREPYLIAGLAIAWYGYSRLRIGSNRSGGALVLIGAVIAGLISPPTLVLILTVVGIALLWEGRIEWSKARLPALVTLILVTLGITVTAQVWSSLANMPQGNLLQTIGYWFTGGAKFELVLLERDSGWVQRLFDQTPEWSHYLMATGNGLVQPFLPAAIADSSSLPLPRFVGLLRAGGWFFLLPFLIYAPFAAVRKHGIRSIHSFLSIAVWGLALLASYRLAGDQWDNPRARAVSLVMQAAIVGWAWVHARQSKSPWLGRMALLIGGASLIFLHWYIGRYYQTPRLPLALTAAATAVYAIGLMGVFALLDRQRHRESASLTEIPPKV